MSESKSEGLDVAYVAHLARLHLTPEEVAHFQPQMEQIVGYVEQISGLDVTDVEPMSHTVAVTNVVREDVSREGLAHDGVMANAPASVDGLFSVPQIVE